MILLSLDQSSTSTGFVVLNDGKIMDMGCIEISKSLDLDLRVIALMHDMEKLIIKYKPTHVCVEEIYARPGRYTAFKALAIVRGALIWVWWRLGLSQLVVISCTHARAQLGIKGNAAKEEIITAVNAKFKLNITNEHTADALVVGVYGYQLLATKQEPLKMPTKEEPKVSSAKQKGQNVHSRLKVRKLSKFSGRKAKLS
jgi:Holliday junction resolvasome RuvABC endonuclease subunit